MFTYRFQFYCKVNFWLINLLFILWYKFHLKETYTVIWAVQAGVLQQHFRKISKFDDRFSCPSVDVEDMKYIQQYNYSKPINLQYIL